jgi:hypothetical protein
MAFPRAQILWDMVKPKAASEGIVSVRPQVDQIDVQLRARIKDVQDDLDIAKGRILTLQARVVALEAKVP